MALNPSLYLNINNSSVKGFNSQQKQDGSIECLSFNIGSSTPIDWSTGSFTGRREHTALSIVKRVDATSPLLWQALCTNQVVAGKIKFYRPPSDGGSKDEQFFTIEFSQGRVASVSDSVNFGEAGSGGGITKDTREPGKTEVAAAHVSEKVTFAYKVVTITYNSADAKGVSYQDDWSASS